MVKIMQFDFIIIVLYSLIELFNLMSNFYYAEHFNVVIFFSEGAIPDAINEFTIYALRLLIEDEKLTRKKYEILVQKAGCLQYDYAYKIMDV